MRARWTAAVKHTIRRTNSNTSTDTAASQLVARRWPLAVAAPAGQRAAATLHYTVSPVVSSRSLAINPHTRLIYDMYGRQRLLSSSVIVPGKATAQHASQPVAAADANAEHADAAVKATGDGPKLKDSVSRNPYPKAVYKFGGSSLGSASAVRRVCDIIRQASHRFPGGVVMVLSAMLGVTDRLIEAGHAAISGNLLASIKHRRSIVDFHETAIMELFADAFPETYTQMREDLLIEVESEIDPILYDAASKNMMSKEDADRLHSAGERMCSMIVGRYLSALSTRARIMLPSFTIITNGEHGDALPDLEATRVLLKPRLERMFQARTIPIVPGFYGGDSVGQITTFGRGGGDLTAAVAGYVIDADEVVLWKVECARDRRTGRMNSWTRGWSGIVHAVDPQRTIPLITYADVHEMAQVGKTVVHHRVVPPLASKDISMRFANTLNPQDMGTLVIPDSGAKSDAIEPYIDQLNDRDVQSALETSKPTTIVSMSGAEYIKQEGHSDFTTASGRLLEHDVDDIIDVAETTVVSLVGLRLEDRKSFVKGARKYTEPLRSASVPFCVVSPGGGDDQANEVIRVVSIAVPLTKGKMAAKMLHDLFVACSLQAKWHADIPRGVV